MWSLETVLCNLRSIFTYWQLPLYYLQNEWWNLLAVKQFNFSFFKGLSKVYLTMLSPSSPYRMIANVCCQQSWESFGTSVSARVKPRKQPVTDCYLTFWVWLHLVQIQKKKSDTNRLCLTYVHNVTPWYSKYVESPMCLECSAFGRTWTQFHHFNKWGLLPSKKPIWKQCPRRQKTNCLHKQTNREELNTHASFFRSSPARVSMNSLIQWVRRSFLVLIKRVLMWLILVRKETLVLMIFPI